ncbi:MAG TPA: 50S ribosomal protein L31 [bacterium]|nr:50S ribosomal protein L31 [bacterium]
MKTGIHPKYEEATITCACGAVINTSSTVKEMRVEICSKCHPIFTGKQKLVDTEGIVDKFKKRMTTAEKIKQDQQGKAKKARKKKQQAKYDIKQIMAEQEQRRMERAAEKKKVEDKKLEQEMKRVKVRKASKEEIAKVAEKKSKKSN